MAGSSEARRRRVVGSLLAVLAVAACTPRAAADPNALWDIVNGQCIPDQQRHGDPAPCALVDRPRGYAVLKDLVGATQFLLIPTERIDGIESPQILAPDAPNYLADAWRARSFVEQRAGRALPRDWLSLAINSAAERSQNQLHIHIDCVRADVRQALTAHAGDIGTTWAPFPVPLDGQRYRAMAMGDAEFSEQNPFRRLADSLPAGDDMGAQTLVVVGTTGDDGREGLVLLAGRAGAARPATSSAGAARPATSSAGAARPATSSADPASAGSGHGEALQDHGACPPPAEVMGK